MPNGADDNKPANDSEQHSLSQLKVPTSTTKQSNLGTEGENRPRNHPADAPEVRREFRWFEFGNLFINGALVIIGICALYIYGGQLKVMRGQLGEIVRQYPELQKSASAARDGVIFARNNAHLDQRAWIGVSNINGKPTLNQPFVVSIEFTNSGRTPAKQVSTTVVVEPLSQGRHPDFRKEDKVPLENHGLLPPGTTNNIRVSAIKSGERLNQASWDALSSGKTTIYVHGVVFYDDVFKCAHKMVYCYVLLPELDRFVSCKDHNDTDENDCYVTP